MSFPPSTSMPPPAGEVTGPVLFFDGACGLCNRLVRVLLRWDREARLHFAPLQGPTAQRYLREHGLPVVDFATLVFVPDWGRRAEARHLLRTDGVIAALRATGGSGARALAAALGVVPRALRDVCYRLVGRTRYALFGPWRPRPLKRPEWNARFLE